MAASRELIKEHYNQHVEEGVTTKEALARRRQGPAAPLKQYHNEIKRRLIYRFAYGAEALLDYACGRGGDLQKWKSAQVAFVKGLDLSPREVEEARRRYGELLQKDRGCSMQAQFEQTDQLGLQLWQEERQYDAATCMFALHYFFEQEATLMMLMQTVAANLKPGGYFFGTVPDGKRVKAHLVKAAGQVSMGHLMLKQEWQGKEAPFGSPYIMEILDTVVAGHEGFSEGSREYLVFEKVLLSVAKKYGLHPVVNFEDPALDALFDEGDAGKPMKHFHPQYPADADPSLAAASKLYMAFVLQKVDSAQEVHAPPLPPPDKGRGPNSQHQRNQQQQQRQSPPREQRLAGGGLQQQQQQQQQQQPDGAMAWRGGGNRKRNADWVLPYPARHLPPQEMPSAFLNVKHYPAHLHHRAAKGRFVIQPPPLPTQCGPVQYDAFGREVYPQLPNGAWISSYYDELNYHAQLQQQQQLAAAAAGQGLPPPQPPPLQQQQQHYGGGGGVVSRQQQPPEQQQQRGMPPPNAAAYPGPPPPAQPAAAADATAGSAAAAAAADAVPADAAGGGRGRGRGRGRKAAAAAAAAAAAEGEAGADVASPTRGRGRGSRGGRAAGSKRARQSSDGGSAAADDAGGDAGEPAAAAAAAGEDEQQEAKRPALQQQQRAAGGKTAAGAGGKAGGPLMRGVAPDPLGYKSAAAVEVSQLPGELLKQLLAVAPRYVE
uniref:mRNA (guanine-N(7))-methyltransferase n=1 Tax=Tetradesmus obliquus TaxID=3088 RepID=A0A383V9F3_TETOB|eukprot:jgi/Sobl393_1/2104/SZX61234.1